MQISGGRGRGFEAHRIASAKVLWREHAWHFLRPREDAQGLEQSKPLSGNVIQKGNGERWREDLSIHFLSSTACCFPSL